ncbi:MAG: 5-formyltetrahydrofolate cyclo-ligase [Spirochaetaceae bacterium]|jgi:5-formyltetrahydrofolate cyclo-ligase|nr:5-formyltetrahydrofolate cyclo-ligase [Spirochaetaceae bacterium]
MPPPEKETFRKKIKTLLASVSPEVFTAAGLEAARYLTGGEHGEKEGGESHPPGSPRGIPGWTRFRSVLVFASLPGEINTGPLMEAVLGQGKGLFAPRLSGAPDGPQGKEKALIFYRVPRAGGPWQAGPFGIREPAPRADWRLGPKDFPALVMVPGLAFDRRGGRLGRGGGYYDRFLRCLDSGRGDFPGGLSFTACGLCLELQLTESVPVEGHDRKMDMILTEKRLIPCDKTPL